MALIEVKVGADPDGSIWVDWADAEGGERLCLEDR